MRSMRKIVEEEKARKYNVRAYTSFPIRNWDHWLPANRQPHAFVQMLGEHAGARPVRRHGVHQAAGIRWPQLRQAAASSTCAWTPDGQSLVFSATRNANRSAYDYTNTELWQIAMTGGEPRRLTGSDALEGGESWSEPKFSPDGRSLYALREGRSDRVFNPTHLGAFDWPAAKERPSITLPAERDVITFAVAPNNRDIYHAQRRLRTRQSSIAARAAAAKRSWPSR